MSDYLFLVKVDEEINSSLCINNFIPNRKVKTKNIINFKLGLYTQSKTDVIWKKIDEVILDRHSITINSQSYNLEIGQIIVVIPVNLNTVLGDNITELPKPLSRKFDKSQVNERASIVFTKKNASSSYQGEFPYQMSSIKKGSLVSFSPLVQAKKEIKTKVVMVNIYSQTLNHKPIFDFIMTNAETKEVVYKNNHTYNFAAIIDLQNIIDDNECIFYSKNLLGIPIYITYDNQGIISVEHTHPPAELFFCDNRFGYQNQLKSNWLKELPDA